MNGKYALTFVVVGIVFLLAACVCLLIPPPRKPMLELDDVRIITSQDVQQTGPVSVTQTFTTHDKVCIFVRARVKGDASELTMDSDELLAFTFTQYYGKENIGEIVLIPHYSPDGWVTGIGCETPEGVVARGEYRVEVRLGNIEVGEVKYRRE